MLHHVCDKYTTSILEHVQSSPDPPCKPTDRVIQSRSICKPSTEQLQEVDRPFCFRQVHMLFSISIVQIGLFFGWRITGAAAFAFWARREPQLSTRGQPVSANHKTKTSSLSSARSDLHAKDKEPLPARAHHDRGSNANSNATPRNRMR